MTVRSKFIIESTEQLLRDNQYQLPTRSDDDNQDPLDSGSVLWSQIPPKCYHCYPSLLLRRNGGNRDRGSGDVLGNDRQYSHRCGGSGGPHDTPGGSDGGHPEDTYRSGSGTSSSSEFGRWHRHDWYSQQHG